MAREFESQSKIWILENGESNQGECTVLTPPEFEASQLDVSLCMLYIHPSSLLFRFEKARKKYLIYHFAECSEYFLRFARYLSLSVFWWLFTKITYSTLVLSYHILDITYHVIFFLLVSPSFSKCCVRLPLSHMWCIYIRQNILPGIVDVILSHFTLLYTLAWYTHFVICSAQYEKKHQPTDCYQKIAHTKHVRTGSLWAKEKIRRRRRWEKTCKK